MVRVNTRYIACGANRANVVSARPSDGLVAFGAGPLVALWNSASRDRQGVHATLSGHQAQISSLKFLDTCTTSKWLATGDDKGTVRLWYQQEPTSNWTPHAILTGHTASVSAIALMELPSSQSQQTHLLVLTGASDASAQAWTVSSTSTTPELVQRFNTGGKFPLDMAMSLLPSSNSIVLAIGCTDTRIQIHTTSTTNDNLHFTKALSLEGHSDWVRCLDFTTPLPTHSTSTLSSYDVEPGQVFLASGSQDNYVRLWRFSRVSHVSQNQTRGVDATLEALELALADTSVMTDDQDDGQPQEQDTEQSNDNGSGELRVKSHDFVVDNDGTFSCAIEAVLLGHDSWVTGLHWAPKPMDSTCQDVRPLRLLSSSSDRSMILWLPSKTTTMTSGSTTRIGSKTISTLWTSQHRFGEFSSTTNLGFFGALWGKQGQMVLANGWGGSWHVWKSDTNFDQQSDQIQDSTIQEWYPLVATGGHFAEVNDVKWDRQGNYLLSTGNDMTTRLHAPWKRTSTNDTSIETWHGADEKLVRVFDTPKVVVKMLKELSEIDLGQETDRPMAANVPPLGLSNRAIADSTEVEALGNSIEMDPVTGTSLPLNFNVESHPPFEEQLLGSTLWPETEKLYGHGFEIVSVAVAHGTSLLASVCKATSTEHAVVRLYDTSTWRQIGQPLKGHSLTITSIKFSSDDKYLVSVSRDRSWQLYERRQDGYELVGSNKTHTRIIWDVCWAKDDSFFATASRDKTVKFWKVENSSTINCVSTIHLTESVTSIASTILNNRHVVAIGLENGLIQLFTCSIDSSLEQWQLEHVLDSTVAHVRTVTALDFCPREFDNMIRLASSSEDRSVRIFDIEL
ncbi:Elongator subunit elp2 [Microbotryomycetes sp. JL221]|nr:Elongator subunit elp2 [Microbotryomycetes sp. JL221]